jgi:hypothetical protein
MQSKRLHERQTSETEVAIVTTTENQSRRKFREGRGAGYAGPTSLSLNPPRTNTEAGLGIHTSPVGVAGGNMVAANPAIERTSDFPDFRTVEVVV